LTLWAMYSLSAPTELASRALRRYLDSGELPDLPVGYTDRVGGLMADVQYTIERLDEAVRSLGELATRDHLTGTYNRRAAEQRLAEDVERAEHGRVLSLALVDLDQMKPINDAHGHRVGDACVVHFAEVVNRNLRAGDWIARWGGDEFVVGMWNTQVGQPTKRVLERIAECDMRKSNFRISRNSARSGLTAFAFQHFGLSASCC
jgi:diguanylate cyclase (GGDEF)-like protein